MTNTLTPLPRAIYRNRDNTPLSRGQIQAIAPSVFAEREDDSRSSRYRFLPSSLLLDRMEDAGFQVVAAQEQSSRQADGSPTRKHLLRFAHADMLRYPSEHRIEVAMINSHNGSSSYKLMAGIFRLVCTNGLMVGTQISEICVRHTGYAADEVIAASLRLAGETPRLLHDIQRMQGTIVTYKDQLDMAYEAARLRLGDGFEKVLAPELLLTPRRHDDIGYRAGGPATLWQAFNRIQENVIKGGVRLRPQPSLNGMRPARRHLRAVNGIDGNTQLNRDLWDMAARYVPSAA